MVSLTLLALGFASPARAQDRAWMFGPFEKPVSVNPIITPNAASTFLSPMTDSVVRWEELATFNPGAVVRNGKVYVLYRAEDVTGKREIGFHTSRLGLAESSVSPVVRFVIGTIRCSPTSRPVTSRVRTRGTLPSRSRSVAEPPIVTSTCDTESE